MMSEVIRCPGPGLRFPPLRVVPSYRMDRELRRKLRLLPKSELHLHLEGSLDPALLLELARRHAFPFGIESLADARQLYSFSDFPGFIHAIKVASQHLIAPEDYAFAVQELGRRLAAQGIVYAEVFISIGILHWKNMSVDPVWRALETARRQLQQERGVRLAWIFDAVRQFGLAPAERVVDEAIRYMSNGPVVGFGIGGDEAGGPAEWFSPVFARAAAAGLGLTAHAGETCGPESVWAAVRDLGVRRIGHGLRAIEDQSLLAHLAGHDHYIDVCPLSNQRTGCWPASQPHPVHVFDKHQIKFSFASDDPGMFGSSLLKELHHCSLEWSSIRRALRNGFLGSFLAPAEKSAYLADLDAAWERLVLPH